MEMGVEKLNMKGVDVYKRNFVEIIISISYFRVPEFREKFLGIILEKSDGVIEEWRNTEGFVLERLGHNTEDIAGFSSPAIMKMFDWASYCYHQIPENMQQDSMDILQRALASDRWKLRIQKRGVAFFLIIKQWVLYVKNTLVSKNVSWKDVPGYKLILKAMLLELKERDVALYPEALKETTCAMLCNEKLLNVFTTIVFKKTHAYDALAVSGALELVAAWLTTLYKNKQLIPPQFDYMFFFKAISILMDLDHGMSTAKVIWFLYKVLHVLPAAQRNGMLQQLLSPEKFYHYFFHWSYNVRMVFHYLYFFQLYQNLNGALPAQESVNLLPEGLNHSYTCLVDPHTTGKPDPQAQSLAIVLSDIQISKISDATRTAQLSQSADRYFFGIEGPKAKAEAFAPSLAKNSVPTGADDKIDRLG